MSIAKTPEPPYYAVIFTSVRTDISDGYDETSTEMLRLAETMPGFLGVESARDALGITVSYWQTPEDIARWRQHAEHRLARQNGRKLWYHSFTTRICRVERAYGFEAGHAAEKGASD
ncbi:antibiotic biosynthesis monooxygenase [Acetobacter farinalis]|uniref:Antibiotic biosynthesis monooxygenase n=1 Tax=Acetobacter farinalis TaxID=1260984 RepID=A0ABT3Q7E2_9PROT|nr:antibiotic biosynthesis monooxygenase [Acetobacter farinalis]MCX2561199.1 antibiotic biosynthesis monooxygenase [Acetobacter farinalis]NHO29831.1 antibiotic biosynthesis monooxygenase [Acetobacter farinalis]